MNIEQRANAFLLRILRIHASTFIKNKQTLERCSSISSPTNVFKALFFSRYENEVGKQQWDSNQLQMTETEKKIIIN